jgi:hypothetical protein
MSRRGPRRFGLALTACLLALVPACGGDSGEPGTSEAPAQFQATAEVDRVMQVVAGTGAAWVLAEVDGGASVLRLDHTGELTEVARLTGQRHEIVPYGEGIVVARVACAGDECEETVAEVRLLDRAGKTVAEEEIARGEGAPYCESGTCDSVRILGVNGDAVWLETWDILPSGETFVSWDPGTGQTSSDRPSDRGPNWRPSPTRSLNPAQYRRPPSLDVAPEPVAAGQDGQVFVLESDGVIRRYVRLEPEETIDVPADIFFQPFEGTRHLYFDKSQTVVVGCILEEWPTARCWISSA